jgi:hypothetical protein
MGFNQVGLWPLLEAIPMPLSEADANALRGFRLTISDANAAGLDSWLILCPNITARPSVASESWIDRIPWNNWNTIRLDDPKQAMPFLLHRASMLSILNNADAYVTIDGDPGGYPGAKPEDFLKIFRADRAAIDKYGINPSKQSLIPWIWCGWGTQSVWGGNPNNPPSLIKPFTRAEMELIKAKMPEPWQLLPGRSHRDNWANGRVNILLADSLGLMNRSTLFCYEAIEFEPTPPATILQFDHIRRILKDESKFAHIANGIFGNAQQPVIVLPNLYFFARGSVQLNYLNKSDNEILNDFANFLGGPVAFLVPALDCLRLNLESLPDNLPDNLRKSKLTGEAAKYIPGGADLYLDILAKQVESRIVLLRAITTPTHSEQETAECLVSGILALVNWWKVHGYTQSDIRETPFKWSYTPPSQLNPLKDWCLNKVSNPKIVKDLAIKLLIHKRIFPESVCRKRVDELFINSHQ